jgi:hypothetical protein
VDARRGNLFGITVCWSFVDLAMVVLMLLPALLTYVLLAPSPAEEGPLPGGAVIAKGSRHNAVAAPDQGPR